MRKIFVSLLVYFLSALSVFAITNSETSFDIVAYRVGGEGEGPFFYIVDALNNSLENVDPSPSGDSVDQYSRDMTEHVSDFLASSLDMDNEDNVLFSFRIEGTTLGSYYVAAAVTEFYPVGEIAEGEEFEPITGSFAFDNMDIRFNRSHTETSGDVSISNKGYDGTKKNTLPAKATSINTTAITDDSGNFALDTNGSNYSSAWWSITSTSLDNTPSSDYWICRGALRFQIDEQEYVASPNGTYRTTVIVEWGTIS